MTAISHYCKKQYATASPWGPKIKNFSNTKRTNKSLKPRASAFEHPHHLGRKPANSNIQKYLKPEKNQTRILLIKKLRDSSIYLVTTYNRAWDFQITQLSWYHSCKVSLILHKEFNRRFCTGDRSSLLLNPNLVISAVIQRSNSQNSNQCNQDSWRISLWIPWSNCRTSSPGAPSG